MCYNIILSRVSDLTILDSDTKPMDRKKVRVLILDKKIYKYQFERKRQIQVLILYLILSLITLTNVGLIKFTYINKCIT